MPVAAFRFIIAATPQRYADAYVCRLFTLTSLRRRRYAITLLCFCQSHAAAVDAIADAAMPAIR